MQLPQQMHPKAMRYTALLSAALLSGVAVIPMQRGLAQSSPACDPPSANEYLLLVANQQSGQQPNIEEQLRQLLPANAAITSCQYLEDQVVRVGGFANAEIAEAWAKYVTDSTGLQAFVAGPTTGSAPGSTPAATETAIEPTPTDSASAANGASNFPTPTQGSSAEDTSSAAPTETPNAQNNTSELPTLNQSPDTGTTSSPASSPTASPSAPTPSPGAASSTPASSSATDATTAPSTSSATPSFDPKPLGAGYAVLVNYANRPEVAADVRQVTSQPVGLVSYNQRPFLLAAYTTDPAAATAVLQSLNDRGFNAIIIDSRSAVLLTPTVVGTGG